jgi:hypothetical protein
MAERTWYNSGYGNHLLDSRQTRMVEIMIEDQRDMRITGGKGFQLDLPNGVTVSVQWGPGNYCDSDVRNADFDAPKKAETWGSNLAECAAFVTDDRRSEEESSNMAWVSVPGFTGPRSGRDDAFYDDTIGYLNVEQVLDFIYRASRLHDHVVEDPTPSDQYPFPLPGQQELDFDEVG